VPPGPVDDRLPEPLTALLEAVGPTAGLVVTRNGTLVGSLPPAQPGLTLAGAGDTPVEIGEVLGEPDALASLNLALLTAPLTVQVAKGAVLSDPVVIIHWVDSPAAAIFPRTLISLGQGAQANVVEVVTSADVAALVVPVTELDVNDAAHLGYLNVQTLGPQVWQLGFQASRVGRDAELVAASAAFGGGYARVRADSTLVGAGGSSRLLAMYFGEGRQMHDFRTVQAHVGPHTRSDLLFKGAVANTSHSVYTGVIRVEKGAVGTNAFQTNRNLVLGQGAHADSVPNLEIEENDVHCSHASAVGPIDEDQRFYLESRGVQPEIADRLITLGFLDDVLVQTPVQRLLPWLRQHLSDKLDRAEAAS
jgi:Fe-S cluster assembly protein SufD